MQSTGNAEVETKRLHRKQLEELDSVCKNSTGNQILNSVNKTQMDNLPLSH